MWSDYWSHFGAGQVAVDRNCDISTLETHASQLPLEQLFEEAVMCCIAAVCANLDPTRVLKAYRQVTLVATTPTLRSSCASNYAYSVPTRCLIFAMHVQVCLNAIAVVPSEHRSAEDRLALAVYPRAAIINHACSPTVNAHFIGRRLCIRAIRDIQHGSILRLCYGPQVWFVLFSTLRVSSLHVLLQHQPSCIPRILLGMEHITGAQLDA